MNPSLLLIPDRYKADKLYSQIPDSGAGDLTFARNSNATRVNSAGLIEKVRENLALQSEAFNTTWLTYAGTSVTANAVTAPNGTLTADRIDGTSAAFRGIYQTITSSAIPHTFSVYLKSATGSSTTCRIWVDSVAFLVTATNDWQRFSVTATTAASFDIQITAAVASAIDIYAWGAQLETGDIATPYIPTTTAAVSVGITANIPRLDYTGGGCPSLLLEPQRTNLVTFSEQFDNAAWTKDAGDTIAANFSISPDGTQNADKIIPSVTFSDSHRVRQSILQTGVYSYSLFAKAAGYNWIKVRMSLAWANVNLNNGSVGFQSGTSAKVESYPNNWYKITISTTDPDGFFYVIPMISDNNNITPAEFSGDGTSGILAWGAQVEAGSYPTSYIPTLGASVTRLADTASKTGISSLIGQTAGTVFADLTITKPTSGNADFLLIENAATPLNGVYVLFMDANGQIGFFSYPSAAFGLINAVNYSNQRIKVAYAYSSAGLVIYINGSQVFLDGSVSLGSGLSTFGLNNPGTATISANVSQTLLYPVRLSSAELASITSL
jgi:hypothetical protein